MIQEFHGWDVIPKNFEGCCKLIRDECFCWIIKGKISHRLDGPAVVKLENGKQYFYINDRRFSENEYWNHPLVIDHKIKTILAI